MRIMLALVWLLFFITISKGEAMANLAARSVEFFQKLDKDNLKLVDQFYDQDVVFQDPIHQLKGVSSIKLYYEGLYKSVDEIRFEFSKQVESQDTAVLVWRMFLKTKAIESGREVTVDGTSVITFGGSEGKAIAHRDYFDMGEFVYEHVPLLKSLIHYIKGRMAGN